MSGKVGLYFALAALGLVSQLAITIVFFADEGLDLALFGEQAVDTTIAVLTLGDLLLCAVAFLVWSRSEARRVGIDPWWPFLVATLGGLCFAFPLFLGYRERRLAETRGPERGPRSAAT